MGVFVDRQMVKELLSWKEAVDHLEVTLKHEGLGKTFVSPKFNSDIETGSMRILFAADYVAGYAAMKAYHTIDTTGSRYLISVIDLNSGELLSIVDGRQITDLRTGAAGGVACRRIPLNDPVSVGLVGSGHQAKAQLQTLATVYDIASVEIFSPTPANREAFALELGRELQIPVVPVPTAEQAVRGKTIVAAATKSRDAEPVVKGKWLDQCKILIAVGNTRPQYQEIDQECFDIATRVIIDSEHALREAGELIEAVKRGVLGPERKTLLYDIVRGKELMTEERMVIFKSVGTALQDLALASRCYELVKDRPDALHFPDLECSG